MPSDSHPIPIDISDCGVYFRGQREYAGGKKVRRPFAVWFRLVDEHGTATIGDGEVEIEINFNKYHPGDSTDRKIKKAVSASDFIQSKQDGQWVWVYEEPKQLMVDPSHMTTYDLTVRFMLTKIKVPGIFRTYKDFYRTTSGYLDVQS